MSDVAPFVFKHVLDGKPIPADNVPKLPMAAVLAIVGADLNDPVKVLRANVECVVHVLRRLDATVAVDKFLEDEDFAEWSRLFEHIKAQNPKFFGPPVPPTP